MTSSSPTAVTSMPATIGMRATPADSDRAWTIVRPGRLLDDPGSGLVRSASVPFRVSVPRDDVAAVLHAVLHEPRSMRRTLYVSAGEDPIDETLARALG
jgi:hypothetical protein